MSLMQNLFCLLKPLKVLLSSVSILKEILLGLGDTMRNLSRGTDVALPFLPKYPIPQGELDNFRHYYKSVSRIVDRIAGFAEFLHRFIDLFIEAP